MAAVLKLNRLTMSPSSALPPGQVVVRADYTNTDVHPNVSGTSFKVMPGSTAEDPDAMMTSLNIQVAIDTGNTIDPAL